MTTPETVPFLPFRPPAWWAEFEASADPLGPAASPDVGSLPGFDVPASLLTLGPPPGFISEINGDA